MSEYTKWLVKTADTITTSDGKTVEIWQLNHREDEEVLSAWAKHFRNHYCLDSEIDFLSRSTGYSKSEYLTNLKFPDSSVAPGPSTRAGDFAEILVADYFEYIMKYWVPRTRYREKISRNESPRGCDVIGFKIINKDQESPEDVLAIIETKAQFSGTKANPRLQNAIDDSIKDQKRIGESLNAIKQRLFQKEGQEIASKIERFQNQTCKPYKEVFGAAALFCDSVFDKNTISSTNASNHPKYDNLFLLIIKGNKMMELVQALYRRAADEA